MIFDHRHSAADRVFLDRRGAGIPSVVHSGPGGRASGWPGGRQAGGLGTPDDPGQGRTPAPGYPAGSGDVRQAAMPGNVAVDPAGAVPARQGAGGCSRRPSAPCYRAPVTLSDTGRLGRTRALPPFWRRSPRSGVADRGAQIWVICAPAPAVGRANGRSLMPMTWTISPRTDVARARRNTYHGSDDPVGLWRHRVDKPRRHGGDDVAGPRHRGGHMHHAGPSRRTRPSPARPCPDQPARDGAVVARAALRTWPA